MSNFLTIPINENGIIIDPNINDEIALAAVAPFRFTDVFIYSHGWWNYATSAVSEYNTFSLGFTRTLYNLVAQTPSPCRNVNAGFSALAMGLLWPSTISQDQNAVTNFLEATSFFTMQQRADSVGAHALYALLRMMIQARAGQPPLRFHLVGHSFGCRVLCSALEELAVDSTTLQAAAATGASFHVALIQAATDTDSLGQGRLYGHVLGAMPDLRLLVTTSRNDSALGKWYPAAQDLAHLFHGPTQAMGAAGPTGNLVKPVTDRVALDPFPAQVSTMNGDFAVVDLTPVHQAHAAAYGNHWGGQHSDINLPEIYELLVRFFC